MIIKIKSQSDSNLEHLSTKKDCLFRQPHFFMQKNVDWTEFESVIWKY